MLVRISDDLRYAGQGGNFLGRTLGVAARDHDLRFRIFTMNSSDGGARILIGRSRNRAGVQHHDSSFRRLGRPHPAPLLELALDSGAVCLSSPATEIYHLEAGHVSILTQA